MGSIPSTLHLYVCFLGNHAKPPLLEGDEARRVGGTNTGLAVLNRSVGDGEFCQVVANHVGLNFDLVEGLAVIDTDDRANHLGDDDHVTEMGADRVGLLPGALSGLLGLAQFLDEAEALAAETTLESAGLGGESEREGVRKGLDAELLLLLLLRAGENRGAGINEKTRKIHTCDAGGHRTTQQADQFSYRATARGLHRGRNTF